MTVNGNGADHGRIAEVQQDTAETADFVTLRSLATQLRMDPSAARRYVLGLGLQFHRRRTAESRNQANCALTREEATRVLTARREAGFLSDASRNVAIVDDSRGAFYVIALVPDLDPRRMKLGFAADVGQRLDQHRTAAPTAELLYAWPCKRVWEQTVMDALSVGIEHLRNEVYTCPDIAALKERGDAFFALLPPV